MSGRQRTKAGDGYAALRRGDHRRAIALLEREQADNPLEPWSLGAWLAASRGIAEALIALGRGREARRRLASSASQRGNPDYWILVAECEYLLGRPGDVARAASRARGCMRELERGGFRSPARVAADRRRRLDRLAIARRLERVGDRSAATLADELGHSRQYLGGLLRELIALRWVERVGGGAATRYRATLRGKTAGARCRAVQRAPAP